MQTHWTAHTSNCANVCARPQTPLLQTTASGIIIGGGVGVGTGNGVGVGVNNAGVHFVLSPSELQIHGNVR